MRSYLGLVKLAVQLIDDQGAAEDVVQDVFARLPRIMKHAAPSEPVRYLRRAVINQSRSALRRRRTVRSVQSRTCPPDATEAADGAVLQEERNQCIQSAVAQLPTRQREIIVLRFFEGLSVTETAMILGISNGAVTSSAGRAFSSLQILLDGVR